MDTVITDGARHFDNVGMKGWVTQSAVSHITTLAYNHRGNGTVERCVRFVLQLLRRQKYAHLNLRRWDLVSEVERPMNFSCNGEMGMMSSQAWDGGHVVWNNLRRKREAKDKIRRQRDKLAYFDMGDGIMSLQKKMAINSRSYRQNGRGTPPF